MRATEMSEWHGVCRLHKNTMEGCYTTGNGLERGLTLQRTFLENVK
jgi:hypothetical protein